MSCDDVWGVIMIADLHGIVEEIGRQLFVLNSSMCHIINDKWQCFKPLWITVYVSYHCVCM